MTLLMCYTFVAKSRFLSRILAMQRKTLVPATSQTATTPPLPPPKRGPGRPAVKGRLDGFTSISPARVLRAYTPISMLDIEAKGAKTVTERYICERLAPVLEAALQSAEIVGRDGAADRRLVCELAGLLHREVHIEQTVTTKRAAGDMPDAVIVWYYMLLNWPRDRWMPGLRDRYEQGLITPCAPETLPPGLPAPTSQPAQTSPPSQAGGVPPARGSGG